MMDAALAHERPYQERGGPMRNLRTGATIAALMIAASPAMAAPMTCADYANPVTAYAYCRWNLNKSGQANCCAGAAAWKAACDVFHVHADSHAQASNLANSTAAGRRAELKDFNDCKRLPLLPGGRQ
jgi:hypothetical protein